MDDEHDMPPAMAETPPRPAGRKSQAPPRPPGRPGKRPRSFLTPQETAWVDIYLRTGSRKAVAAAMAEEGRSTDNATAHHFLQRAAVRKRIKEIVTRAQAEHIELSRHGLLSELRMIIAEGRPFERVKAIELIAKVEGLFAPRHQITTHRTLGISPYVELAETLKTGTKFAPEERAQMRQQLLVDAAAIQEVLGLLVDTPISGGH